MLVKDYNGTLVRTKTKSVFPKGTVSEIVTCRFIEGTSTRAYLIRPIEKIEGMIDGATDWYLERDLENVE